MENIIDSTNPDIVIAIETWLDPTITNNQVFHPTTQYGENIENTVREALFS